MNIPKTKTAWKRLQPSNIKQAFRFCKEYARHHKRLTVPAIAELMGKSDDLLYKWLSNGEMPTTLIPAYEHICGIDYVTQYLAYRGHKLLIDIPAGGKVSELDSNELQIVLNDAVNRLLHFYQQESGFEETFAALTKAMCGLAYHRKNIQTQQELALFDGDEDE